MGFPPIQPQDAFESINSLAGSGSLSLNPAPEIPAGYADRQSKIQSELLSSPVRNIVRWLVPNSGVVEMYVNPRSIKYEYKKIITPTRTKGGFSLQYWGEDLIKLVISGTTGTSGIEGINVLHDIYRSEQLAFDPYALALSAEADAKNNSLASMLNISNGIIDAASSLFGGTNNIPRVAYQHPSLATLAFQIEMYWSGWVYRGYFENFSVDESADKLGMFDYTISFVATQRRGRRSNFMPWHKSATKGPSNNSQSGGIPYTFQGISENNKSPQQNQNLGTSSAIVSAWDDLTSATGNLQSEFSKF